MIRIGVENFGPITRAMVELKPLTVFVGPNNTGKSYLALLIYAISRAASKLAMPPYGITHRRPDRFHIYPDIYMPFGIPRQMLSRPFLDGRTLNTLQRRLPPSWGETMTKTGHARPLRLSIPFDSLPKQMMEVIDACVAEYLDSFAKDFDRQLKRCYSARLPELVCKLSARKEFSLFIEQEKPELRLRFDSAGRVLTLSEKQFSLRKETIRTTVPDLPLLYRYSNTGDKPEEIRMQSVLQIIAQLIVFTGIEQFIMSMNIPRIAYYLPAARSGILQGQKALASSLAQWSSLAGIEPIEIPNLSGVIADFLQALYSIDKDERGDFYKEARDLEQRLTPGRIEAITRKHQLPEIYFREPIVGRVGLHRTSSMISELAPIILFLRYYVKKGNLIILEEPEAHVHPAAQRELAKLLVRLVRGGVKVLLTTHSDYLLQQISNLVTLSTKPNGFRENLGYTAEEVISPEEVAAYLFKRATRECGSEAVRLEVGENGICEEEFGAVAEALYHETIEARRKESG